MFTVLLALIAIVLAALLVLSWDGNDGDAGAPTTTTGQPDDATTTTAPSTTTVVPVTTSIPVDCGTDPETGESTTTTVDESTSATDTTTTVGEDTEPEPDAATGPTLGRNSSLSTVGLDTVTFGLTVNQAERASGHDLIACGAVTDCYRVTPDGAPAGISFVVDKGTIERVDIVGDSVITTLSGAGIGSTDDELDELFGDRLERVDLGGGRTDVVFVPSDDNDRDFRVVFTTLDGEVESLRSGRVPLVLETEACSRSGSTPN
jgi:hypothetical protein